MQSQRESDSCSFLALFFDLSHGCRPLRASSSPLSLFPYPYLLAHSYKMNNDQGRDQDVFPERNEFHTDLTPSGLTSADSAAGSMEKLSSICALTAPPAHPSRGNEKELFF